MKKQGSRISVELSEDVFRGCQKLTVNRDTGVISGIKILGLISDNGRRYTLEACHKAAPLYNNRRVNIDHPVDANGNMKPTRMRSSYDRFAKIINVRPGDDGLYGDLKMLKTHPMTSRIYEAAEDPELVDLFGFSHNAQGDGDTENGQFVVQEITQVRHVDLVADPATTKSLCESRMKTKTKKEVGEMGYEADQPLDMETPPEEEETGWREHCANAIGAILNDDSLSPEEMKDKIDSILDAAIDKGPEEKPTEEGDEGDEGKKKEEEKKKMPEAAEAKAKRGKELAESRERICKLAGVTPNKELMESLMELSEGSFIKMLEQLKPLVNKPGWTAPRSQPPTGGAKPKHLDVKEFSRLVRDGVN